MLCLFIVSSAQPLAITDLFTVSRVLPFPACYIVRIIQYIAFPNWLLSLSNMHLSLLHVLSGFDGTFLFFFFFFFKDLFCFLPFIIEIFKHILKSNNTLKPSHTYHPSSTIINILTALFHLLPTFSPFSFNFFFKFIYFWLCWVFVAVPGLSLVASSRGYPSLRCTGFSMR